MKLYTKFFFLIGILAIVSCQNNDELNSDVVITGSLQHLSDTSLVFSYDEYRLLSSKQDAEIFVDSNGFFKIVLSSDKPISGFISFGKSPIEYRFDIKLISGKDTSMEVSSFDFKIVYLYLQAGDSIHLTADIDNMENSLEFYGDGKNNNTFINEIEFEFNDYKHKYLGNYYNITFLEEEAYKKSVDSLCLEKINKLHSYNQNHPLSEHLIKVSEANYKGKAIRAKNYYPDGHAGFNGGKFPELSDAYYSYLDSLKFPSTINEFDISAYYFLNSVVKKKFELAQLNDTIVDDIYEFAESILSERLLYEFKAYALSRDFKKELYDVFDKDCPYPDIAFLVKEKYQHLEGMLEGKKFMNFNLIDINGKSVSLESLNGNFILIDFWASWCGPCIKEIPALKILEEHFKNDPIHFVSISFDKEKDSTKWHNYVIENNLKGIQLKTTNAQHDELAKALNIKMIPRFVLLDKEAKIIDANAIRPSNPKMKAKLYELINN